MIFTVIPDQNQSTIEKGILITHTEEGDLRVISTDNQFTSFEVSNSSLTPANIKYPGEAVNHILIGHSISEEVYVTETASLLIYNICDKNRIFF